MSLNNNQEDKRRTFPVSNSFNLTIRLKRDSICGTTDWWAISSAGQSAGQKYQGLNNNVQNDGKQN